MVGISRQDDCGHYHKACCDCQLHSILILLYVNDIIMVSDC